MAPRSVECPLAPIKVEAPVAGSMEYRLFDQSNANRPPVERDEKTVTAPNPGNGPEPVMPVGPITVVAALLGSMEIEAIQCVDPVDCSVVDSKAEEHIRREAPVCVSSGR